MHISASALKWATAIIQAIICLMATVFFYIPLILSVFLADPGQEIRFSKPLGQSQDIPAPSPDPDDISRERGAIDFPPLGSAPMSPSPPPSWLIPEGPLFPEGSFSNPPPFSPDSSKNPDMAEELLAMGAQGIQPPGPLFPWPLNSAKI
jgi:hypothetical protein